MTLYAVPELRVGDWADEAACRGVDPELFFPGQGEDTRRAKAICATCTVIDDCLNEALRNREKFGIWGGLSERERRRIRNGRPVRNNHGTNAGYQQHRRLHGTEICDACKAARRLYETTRRRQGLAR